MKRLLFSSMLFCAAALCSTAATTLQLVFRTTSGSTFSFETKDLVMTFSDNSLSIKNSYTEQTLALNELSAMYFENAESGIKTPETTFNSGKVEVFTLSGVSAGTFESLDEAIKQLAPGLYISGSLKFQVK